MEVFFSGRTSKRRGGGGVKGRITKKNERFWKLEKKSEKNVTTKLGGGEGG